MHSMRKNREYYIKVFYPIIFLAFFFIFYSTTSYAVISRDQIKTKVESHIKKYNKQIKRKLDNYSDTITTNINLTYAVRDITENEMDDYIEEIISKLASSASEGKEITENIVSDTVDLVDKGHLALQPGVVEIPDELNKMAKSIHEKERNIEQRIKELDRRIKDETEKATEELHERLRKQEVESVSLLDKKNEAEDQALGSEIKLTIAQKMLNRSEKEREKLQRQLKELKNKRLEVKIKEKTKVKPKIKIKAETLDLENRFDILRERVQIDQRLRVSKHHNQASDASRRGSRHPSLDLKRAHKGSSLEKNIIPASQAAVLSAQPVVRNKINYGVLFVITSTTIGAAVALAAWYMRSSVKGEQEKENKIGSDKIGSDKIGSDKIAATKIIPPPKETLSFNSKMDYELNETFIKDDQTGDTIKHSQCSFIYDYSWFSECQKLEKNEDIDLFVMLWNVRKVLLLVKYHPIYLNETGILSNGELPEQSQDINTKKWMLAGYESVLLESLKFNEVIYFFNLIKRDDSMIRKSLSEQMQALNIYGKTCGIMPHHYAEKCRQLVSDEIQKNTALEFSKELTTIPSTPVDFKASLDALNTFGMLPVWSLTDTLKLSGRPDFYPVVKERRQYKLLYDLKPAPLKEWHIRTTGSYTVRSFQKLGRGQWGWITLENTTEQLAGRKIYFNGMTDSVQVFDGPDTLFSYISVNNDSQLLSMGWGVDYGQKSIVNKLLLTLKPKKVTLVDGLEQWSVDCINKEDFCQIQKYNLYKGATKIDEASVEMLNRSLVNDHQAIHYHPYKKAIPFKKLTPDYRYLWLETLSFTYDSTGLYDLGITVSEFADASRIFCGTFLGKHKRSPLFSCLHDLAQSYHKPNSWRISQLARWFVESFPSEGSSDKSQIAISSIRYRYDNYNISQPLFLPVFQKNSIRNFHIQHTRKVHRSFKLPVGSYDLFMLSDEMILEPRKILNVQYQEQVHTIDSGVSMLVNKKDITDKFFIIHEQNPFSQEPLPAYQTNSQLYLPEDVYPSDTHWFIDIKMEANHGNQLLEQPYTLCESIEDEAAQQVCTELLNVGELEALIVFFTMYKKYGEYLSLPFFKIVDHFLDNKEDKKIRDNPLYDSSLYQLMNRISKGKKSGKKDFIWMTNDYQLGIENLPKDMVTSIITRYVEVLIESGIFHGRDWGLYILMSHCGVAGQPLRDKCSKHITNLLKQQEQWKEFPGMRAYRHSIGKYLSQQLSLRKNQGAIHNTIMRLVWYIDQDLNFHGLPKYRMCTIGFREGEYAANEFYHDIDSSEKYLHDLIIKGLTPGTTYTLWYFDNGYGEWTSLRSITPDFTVNKNQTDFYLKSFPIVGSFGISRKGCTEPESFFHLTSYGIPEGESAKQVEQSLIKTIMPLTLWPQNIHVIPSVLREDIKTKYIKYYETFMRMRPQSN